MKSQKQINKNSDFLYKYLLQQKVISQFSHGPVCSQNNQTKTILVINKHILGCQIMLPFSFIFLPDGTDMSS